MNVGGGPQFPEKPRTLVELIHLRAHQLGAKRAFTFLPEGERPVETFLTFGELNHHAQAIAHRLQSRGLSGERTLLLYPPGLEFLPAFLGALAAGVVAVPAHLPRINRPMTRLRAIVKDAEPQAILTIRSLLPDSEKWIEGIPELRGLPCLATDEIVAACGDPHGDFPALPLPVPESPAFLQYTSGSTAIPKGVIVSHANLMHNSEIIQRCFGATEESRGVFWLPMFHDMGLIGGFLQTVYCGGSSTLLSPLSFLQRPWRWLKTISDTGATISGGPNFAFDLCARKITPEQRAQLDLGRWTVAFNGAEPVRAETLDRFAQTFGACGFRREAFLPCFGLAEGTLLVSGNRPGRAPVVVSFQASALDQNRAVPEAPNGVPTRMLAGSGKPGGDLIVAIVDPQSRRAMPPGAVGEIWVKGQSVAQGYWQRPDLTAETFRAVLADSGDGPYLRTGDLGFVHDGELFVTGRLKDLLIIRGRNVYPSDLEWTSEHAHAALRSEGTAAFAVEVDGEERLIIVAEVDRLGKGADPEPVLAAIRLAIADQHDLDLFTVCLIKAMTLPKTSSGKVQRHVCREAFLAGTLEQVAQWQEARSTPALAETAVCALRASDQKHSREIAEWLSAKIAAPLGVSPSTIDIREPFVHFGLGSLQTVRLAADLEQWLGRSLSPTLVYDYPTIDALARHLAAESELAKPSDSTPARSIAVHEPIAIIGLGCRFPGAAGPVEFWNLLAHGRDGTTETPADRWTTNDSHGTLPPRSGFLDRVDLFDADFFGISPREAQRLDPQHRLLLEVTWEALEDAGHAPERLAGSRVGVFVGISTNDYARLVERDDREGDAYLLTGNAASVAANRLSYAFDFRGPSLAVDTACSSSLVAVHLACQALRRGEATLAIAGGVNLILSPEIVANFAQGGFLALDGRCKTFDASANGYARGEGAGVVVLKPLAQAVAEGDDIYAVVRGSAINQDGRGNGLTAPNGLAQEAVLTAAYEHAGRSPGNVQYVEAHGTGTPLGDPIEAKALGAVLGKARGDRPACWVGSVKTNIGHLEAAAGVAGLIKTALAVRKRAVPPNLHFHQANPLIPLADLRLRIPTQLETWPESAHAPLAAVSSFGFGGTNAHVVLEAAPIAERDSVATPAPTDAHVLAISARSEAALRAAAESYRSCLAATNQLMLSDLCHSTAIHKGHHDYRLGVTGTTTTELRHDLDAFLAGKRTPALTRGRRHAGQRPRVVFVFSGQGGLWPEMGCDLLDREPIFKRAIEECDRLSSQLTGWSLIDELGAEASRSRLRRSDVAQPVQFAVQVALAALWRSWGIRPEAVVGHSLGEAAAAHIAGALSLPDAVRLAVERGRAMQRAAGQGKTLATALGADEAAERVGELKGTIAIAALNGPRSTTLSGDAQSIESLAHALSAEGVFAKLLDVDVAFHGPSMEGPSRELARALAGMSPRDAAIPFYSAVTGSNLSGLDLIAEYWARNIRQPVRFSDAISALLGQAHDLYLEIAPHPILARSIADQATELGRPATTLASIRRGQAGRPNLLQSLAEFYVRGIDPVWTAIERSGRFIKLPAYPWQRERFWITDRNAPRTARSSSGIDLQGSASAPDEPRECDSLITQLQWRMKEPAAGRGRLNGHAGRWAIVPDSDGLAEAMQSHFDVLGISSQITAPESSGAAASGARNGTHDPLSSCQGVLYLAGLDLHELTFDAVENDQAAVSASLWSLAQLVQRLAQSTPDRPPPRLWVVTRGAQAVLKNEPLPGVVQSVFWGMGRSIALEHPDLWGGLIDLDPEAPGGCLAALAHEIAHPRTDDQVAFRQGQRFVARLAPYAKSAEPQRTLTRGDGTYLITGGFGGLGLKFAEWLVDQGARRLVLVGRRAMPPRSDWAALKPSHPMAAGVSAVRQLEARGVCVLAFSADVADRAQMARIFDRCRVTLPPLRGIAHAAGVVDDDDAMEATPERWNDVLRPKIAGTSVLDQLSRDLPLDWFLSFSSVASLLGAKETAYAAANAFLDAFAQQARSFSRPMLSMNFGPWQAPGMAASATRQRGYRALGLKPLEPSRALAAIGQLLETGAANVAVADVDWFTLKTLYEIRPERTLLADVDAAKATHARSTDQPARTAWRHLPADQRRETVSNLVREQIARVLGLNPARVEMGRALTTMGLDSLMAMELINAFRSELELGLPLTTLLHGPTIEEIVELALQTPVDSAPLPLLARSATERTAPLSPEQQALWYLHQVAPDTAAHTIAGAARVRTAINRPALESAARQLMLRHEALRTTFTLVDDHPVQQIHESLDPEFLVQDEPSFGDDQIQGWINQVARAPFDLESGPLFRVGVLTRSEHDHVLALAIHHAVSDFWSVAVLVDELVRFYSAQVVGQELSLERPRLRHADFARWHAEMLAGEAGERHWSFWQDQLEGTLPELSLPTDRPRPPLQRHRGATLSVRVDEAISGGITDICTRLGASPYVTLLSAFQVVLARYAGQTEVIVGSPVAGRSQPGLENVLGYFVNLLPMRASLAGNPTFSAFLASNRQTVAEALEHQDFPYASMVQRKNPSRDPSRSPIFQAMFIYQKAQRFDSDGLTAFSLNEPGVPVRLGDFAFESASVDRGASLFDITLAVGRAGDHFTLAAEYDTDLFDETTITRMLAHFQALLREIIADPERGVLDLPLMPERDFKRLVSWSAGSSITNRSGMPLHQRIERHAQLTPEAIAVIDDSTRISYAELDQRAGRLAHQLLRMELGPEARVALCVPRTVDMLIGVLGILKAGAAYVPIDPDYPANRVDLLLEQAGAAVLVSGDGLLGHTLKSGLPVVATDSRVIGGRGHNGTHRNGKDKHQAAHMAEASRNGNGRAKSETAVGLTTLAPRSQNGPNGNGHADNIVARPADAHVAPEQLAYVVFTSGSTGVPKGVMVSHANLINAYEAWEAAYGLGTQVTRHLQMAGFAFDVFTGDWARALGSGGTLVICPKESVVDAAALYELLDRERIECAEFVPAVLENLVSYLEQTGARLDELKLVAVGSDVFHAGLHQRLRGLIGPGARIINSYGLTEATIDSTFFDGALNGVPSEHPVPIGGPFAGSTVHVVDERLNPVPPGVVGELIVGGANVSRGYLGEPGLTAQRFVPDPFSFGPGARLYRTGDRARWRADGVIELLGRGDSQVKIRGVRIELGEVEAALLRDARVREAVAVAAPSAKGTKQLVAYVVPADRERVSGTELRSALRESLPEPMVPARIVVVDKLPLSTNGKIDRQALLATTAPEASDSIDFTAPRNSRERVLAEVACEVLGLRTINVLDNLFALGVDSISGLRIISRARQAGITLRPVQLFKNPTIAELAALVADEPSRSPAIDPDEKFGINLESLAFPVGGARIEDAYPLSPVQHGMLFHTLSSPGSGVYVEQLACAFNGPFDRAAFHFAWRQVAARHPALRSAIHSTEPDRPLQVIFSDPELPLETHDWSPIAVALRDERFEQFLREDRERGFDLSSAPLMRLTVFREAAERHRFVWTMHHIAIDGWCAPILLSQVLTHYEATARGASVDIEWHRPYRDYIAWLQSRDLAAAEAYWKRALAGFGTTTPLGIDSCAGATATHEQAFAERELTLSSTLTAALGQNARLGRWTLNTIAQSAWALLLSRYSGRGDIVFGVAVSGRPSELDGAESMIGMFINSLPLRIRVNESDSLHAWLTRIQEQNIELRDYEHSPLTEVHGWSDLPRAQPLFESILVFENFPIDAALVRKAGALGIDNIRVIERTHYPLTITIVPGERLLLRAGYDASRFEADTVERLLAHLSNVLAQIADAGPHARLADLSLMSRDEQNSVLAQGESNNDAPPIPRELRFVTDDELDSLIEQLEATREGDSP
jgi:amino acid adenylation domain-containing protein